MSYSSMEKHVRPKGTADLSTTTRGFFALYQGTTLVVPLPGQNGPGFSPAIANFVCDAMGKKRRS
jgi:hypothetical protein